MDKQTKGYPIPIKRVVFNNGSPDFIYSVESWTAGGGYKGFLKENCINISDVLKVQDDSMPSDEFHSLPAWEG